MVHLEYAVSSATFNERIFSLAIYNNQLYAGGRFTNGGGVNANYLASLTEQTG
jgi:hypothetical protein